MLERFFDEAGGMQLVIHSPFGSRINRAWGLALRKRFCRKFNFELQAAATEDNIVLSLTTAHSFDLEEVVHYLHSRSVRPVLVQAMLDSPMFTHPLALGGRRRARPAAVPQRQEGAAAIHAHAGGGSDRRRLPRPDRLRGKPGGATGEVPDHPLTDQAIADCLHEAMDIEGLEALLRRIEAGDVRVVACDLTQPSPLALEVLSARPHAFLDDAPLEERRTQAVMARRWHAPQSASELGRLDADAITRGARRCLARPHQRRGVARRSALARLPDREGGGGGSGLGPMAGSPGPRQARHMPENVRGDIVGPGRAADSVPGGLAGARLQPPIAPPASQAGAIAARDPALVEILRGRLEGLGPTTQTALAASLGLDSEAIGGALVALETEGTLLRGRFSPGVNDEQWCDRRLLARIHHFTIRRLRSEIEPVAARDFLRFLFAWQHVAQDTRLQGPAALRLRWPPWRGFEAPANAWETEILPARVSDYEPAWLDAQCLAGRSTWARLIPPTAGNGEPRGRIPVRSAPISLLERRKTPLWMSLAPAGTAVAPSPRAQSVLDCLAAKGALFFDELAETAGLLRSHVEESLGELVTLGRVSSDSFGGLRALLVPAGQRKSSSGAKRRGRVLPFEMESGGRWAQIPRSNEAVPDEQSKADRLEYLARTLLRRYGIVFWRVLARETGWLPPWRDLLRVYRRLEARGEIRGGRLCCWIFRRAVRPA
ncbi:MAG: hypothetical protein WDN49_04895 [Acetobacteraceae bacterium]